MAGGSVVDGGAEEAGLVGDGDDGAAVAGGGVEARLADGAEGTPAGWVADGDGDSAAGELAGDDPEAG